MPDRDRETRERPSRDRPVEDDPKYYEQYKMGQELAKKQWDMGKPLSHVTEKSELEKPFYKGIYDMNNTLRGQKEQGKGMKKGGMVKSGASKRADGCAVKGKTRGKMV